MTPKSFSASPHVQKIAPIGLAKIDFLHFLLDLVTLF